MTHIPPLKALTHDEKKAADAAFAGRPFNEAWSASARTIYDGIVKALPRTDLAAPDPTNDGEVTEAPLAHEEPAQEPAQDHAQAPLGLEHAGGQELVEQTAQPSAIRDREAAIQAGILIDVTPTAQKLGITFPVTMTRPLWEAGIVTNQALPEEEQTSRLRDVLMAFRLRLAGLTTVSPLIDFPVLLALPPSQVPQPVPLFALIQADPMHQANVTLLMPNEVSLSITSQN
jgi:hypothetical protein